MPEAVPQLHPPERRSQGREDARHPRGLDRFVQRHELSIVLLLCILGAARIFIFSTAFPMFNNVDEPAHFDLVCVYAQGHMPAQMEKYNPEAVEVLSWYPSPDYLSPQEAFDQGAAAPPAKEIPPAAAAQMASATAAAFSSWDNPESTQPPVYYAVAGAWYRLGKLLGFSDIRLAYWTRWLNVLIYGLLVWTAYACIRRLYPGNLALRIGVPLLVAFFPQDVFYGINNDVMSPLLFTAAFYSLLRVCTEGSKSRLFHLVTGLSVAAAFLVKVSNVTIFLPLGLVLITVLRKARAEGRLRKALPGTGLMVLAAVAPVALWMARNYSTLGDLTGAADKITLLGWTYKPLAEVFHHPVFSPAGAWVFLSELIAWFWRGEYVWRLIPIAMPACDLFYVLTTLAFVGAAVAALLGRRERRPADERYAGWMGVAVLAASVMMMLVLSIMFDFGGCYYPSAEFPFFVSGRLIVGAVVPFMILYVTGLDYLMARLRLNVSRLWVLLAIVVLITGCETALSLKVFASPYNWFHL